MKRNKGKLKPSRKMNLRKSKKERKVSNSEKMKLLCKVTLPWDFKGQTANHPHQHTSAPPLDLAALLRSPPATKTRLTVECLSAGESPRLDSRSTLQESNSRVQPPHRWRLALTAPKSNAELSESPTGHQPPLRDCVRPTRRS